MGFVMTVRLSYVVGLVLFVSSFEVDAQQEPGVATVRQATRDPESFWQSPEGASTSPPGFRFTNEHSQSSHPQAIQSRLNLTADQLAAAGLADEANALWQLARRVKEQHFERLLAQHNEVLIAARKPQIGLHVQTIEYVPSPEMDAAILRLLKQVSDESETAKSHDQTESKQQLQGNYPAVDLKSWIDEMSRNRQLKILSDINVTLLDGRRARFLGDPSLGESNEANPQRDSTSLNRSKSGPGDATGSGQFSLLASARVLNEDIIRIGLTLDYQDVHEKAEIDHRRLQTDVELKEGQSMVSSGLERTRNVAEVTRIPVLGEVPIVGSRLFSRKKIVPVKTELLFVITPEIIVVDWPSSPPRSNRSPIQPTKHTLPPR